MLGGGSFIEGEEEEEGGEEAMESSPESEGGGCRHPHQVRVEEGKRAARSGTGSGGRFWPGDKGMVRGCEEGGKEQDQDDVDMSSGHDGTDCPSNYSSESTARPGSSKSKWLEKGRVQTHREMVQAMQEMKKMLPSEKRGHCKARTVEALDYALSCVKKVQANNEYHKLLLSSRKEERREVEAAACSLEELDRVTSEHTLKNMGTFVAVFSLASGRVVYISEQASSLICCERSFLGSVRFVELLYHQDVNVFYSRTAQSRLPPWSMGSNKAILYDCALVKSFFCRIRGGKDGVGEMRYNPFRITPYLLKVKEWDGDEGQTCCLVLAERIHSGYEAPRIPLEKCVFTTTHSPGCVFMEVDDRAVPLLGYLPQDLIGSSVLACLHPEDRPLMLALHRKILEHAGQSSLEHSPLHFRCQNGDYVTVDTSWSSFVNPWSRKVAFVIGRHRVRTGPLNEEVFAAQSSTEQPGALEEIRKLQAQIYRLFLQPVHNNGSSGYGSMASIGSHEPYFSMASSSDSNGNMWGDTRRESMKLRQICADINKVKSWGQQAYLDSRRKLIPMGRRIAAGPTAPPLPPASQPVECGVGQSPTPKDSRKQPHVPSYQQINCVDSIIRYLESYTVPTLKQNREPLSIAASSSSSFSEEDKAPESMMTAEEAMLDTVATETGVPAGLVVSVVGTPLTDLSLSTKALSVASITSQCSYSSTIVHVPQPESGVTALEDALMGSEQADPTPPPPPRPQPSPVGLTKKVLSAHTQKEEEEYVGRFRHRILQSPYSSYLQRDGSSQARSQHHGNHGERPAGGVSRRKVRTREPKARRHQEQQSSDSYTPPPEGHRVAPAHSLYQTWPPSETSGPPLLPPFQPPCFAPTGQQGQGPVVTNASLYPGPRPYSLPADRGLQATPNAANVPPVQAAGPYVAPVMTLILPNFLSYPNYPMYAQGVNPLAPAPPLFPRPLSPSGLGSSTFPASLTPALASQALSSPGPPSVEQTSAQPTHLFSSSRSSSPLQLDLLQEELPKPTKPPAVQVESPIEEHDKGEENSNESRDHDAQSTSSELLDLLLQEDAHSRTGSNASGSGSGEYDGSLGSGSNGTFMSHTGSSNSSSRYFTSNDGTLHTSRQASMGQAQKDQVAKDRANFEQCVGNSLWSLIQQMPEPVMMTYQISPRDQAQVLKEDREKLLLLQSKQPSFTEEQKKELAEVHPWIKQHRLPEEINTQGCGSCNPTPSDT